MAKLDTIRMLLVVATQENWKVHQHDVKSTFLNDYLVEEIFIEQPEGFVVKGEEDKVYLLKKALYDLKQALRAWYNRIDDHLLKIGFERSLSEIPLYVKIFGANIIIISLYVDDLLVTRSNSIMVQQFKDQMMEVFKMTNLGVMSYFLGMEILQS